MAVNHREEYEQLPHVRMQRAIRSYQRHIVPRQAALIEAWAHGEHPADEDGDVAFIESTRPFRRQMAAYLGGATGNTALTGRRWLPWGSDATKPGRPWGLASTSPRGAFVALAATRKGTRS